jgi:uncharacterized membrane protein
MNKALAELGKQKYFEVFLLLIWLLIGTILRAINLEAKPPWSDEWATLVFSLGHSFKIFPLNELISLDLFWQPLQLERINQIGDVIYNLMNESTHPPVYFALTHFWLKLFSSDRTGLVSIGWARALSAGLGIACIPAIYGLSRLIFSSRLAGQMAAGLMAVSPYSIYLSQEARHYNLAILWVIASLACLFISLKAIKDKRSLSWWIVITWIIVNSLAIATHYFFGLVLVAETFVLLNVWWRDWQASSSQIFASYWSKTYAAIGGTLVGCSVWIFFWLKIPDNQLTTWVYDGNPLAQFYEPLLRLLVWIITMVFILPVEGIPEGLAIFFGGILLLVLAWITPSWWRAGKVAATRWEFRMLSQFVLAAIALILVITYLFGEDLTLSARFQFIYFPAILLLLAAIMELLWHEAHILSSRFKAKNKKVIYVTFLLGMLGAITVNANLAFQKVEHPDLLTPIILEARQLTTPDTPTLIATVHRTHGETREMMSLAWQFYNLGTHSTLLNFQPQFLLVHPDDRDEQKIAITLEAAIKPMTRPFQLWLINFLVATTVEQHNCIVEENYKGKVKGYRYQLYHCFPEVFSEQ